MKVVLMLNGWNKAINAYFHADKKHRRFSRFSDLAKWLGGFQITRGAMRYLVVDKELGVELVLRYGPTEVMDYDTFEKIRYSGPNLCNEIELSK